MKEESNQWADETVLVGKVSKPHGIKGELKIYPYSGSPVTFKAYSRLLVCSDNDSNEWYALLASRPQGKYSVVTLSGIANRDQAEMLIGCQVRVDRQEMPELADDEFYWHDLQGMDVVTKQGEQLGRISSLLATGAHDILVVTGTGKEYLIPALDGFIVEVDGEAGTVMVDPPEGLLDINR